MIREWCGRTREAPGPPLHCWAALNCWLALPRRCCCPLPAAAAGMCEALLLPAACAAQVWAVAHVMCRQLAAHPEAVRGCRVLELGAGTGVAGILAAKLGAAQVGGGVGFRGRSGILAAKLGMVQMAGGVGFWVGLAGGWGGTGPECARAGGPET